MRRPRFKTQLLNGWNEIDPYWLREVQINARFLWIRFAGLWGFQPYKVPDDDHVEWERVATRIARKTQCAYLIVWFGRTTKGDVRDIGRMTSYGLGMDVRGRGRLQSDVLKLWPHTMTHVAGRVDLLLRQLSSTQPWPIGVLAEDFAARWVAASSILPEVAILDNPMMSIGEAKASALYSRPGLLRYSDWPALHWYDEWGLHFPATDLVGCVAGLHTSRRHGTWAYQDQERRVPKLLLSASSSKR